MFEKLLILDDSHPALRTVADEVKFPLKLETKKLIKRIIKELRYSQIEELAEKYDLRPGMGLAFPQLGINERIIIVVIEEESEEDEEQIFSEYVFINPKILSYSDEEIAAGVGEGCLSVNYDVEGHVKRYARIKVEAFDVNGKKFILRAREELAIVIQHEIDHLNGILFYDRIDKNKVFYSEEELRLI